MSVAPIVIEPVTLTGSTVEMEPLDQSHHDDLFDAAQDERIWTHTGGGSSISEFDEWYEKAMGLQQNGGALVFAVRLLETGKLVGSSRYMNIFHADRRLEIGTTWYNPAVWSSKVNPECKYLLMTNAFEKIGCYRVEYRCDSRNRRSRAAILKLGATEEGTLRRHMRTRGDYWRDTLQFSILDSEWPEVKAGLEKRLG